MSPSKTRGKRYESIGSMPDCTASCFNAEYESIAAASANITTTAELVLKMYLSMRVVFSISQLSGDENDEMDDS